MTGPDVEDAGIWSLVKADSPDIASNEVMERESINAFENFNSLKVMTLISRNARTSNRLEHGSDE